MRAPKRNTGGTTWEWIDVPVEDFQMFDKIISSKKVVVRFHGSTHYSDFVVPESQRERTREVYLAWKARGGKEERIPTL